MVDNYCERDSRCDTHGRTGVESWKNNHVCDVTKVPLTAITNILTCIDDNSSAVTRVDDCFDN